ncbi:methyl-accepting chemotaxis protein [Paraglaciecola aquimarina]|uniref:Methyl-accepting chemotaxis protein n=1 Tax=Paraglaciecola algarum TaxID=3050085 RepID=A0ABS9D1S6_9ALTE|nr:methyl-accepting chemotaxis protein [Paraglaciecola sp. G1-23]MCF2946705.1 methyl-accepting chemotaxis protein [Paraglaciecola sp. G1-23]
MPLKIRLLISTLSIVLLCVLLLGGVSVYVAVNESNQALTQAVKERLVSQNVQTGEAISEYFSFIESQIRAKSYELSVVEAAEKFIPAFEGYTQQRGQLSSSNKSHLENYYQVDFTTKFNNFNTNPIDNASDLLAGLSENALALQYDFIAGSTFALGEKDGLAHLGNGSEYAKQHSVYHDTLRQFLNEFGYYDIFIADINTGNIVYSVFKELDFATSIKHGPYANTGIGEVFAAASNANNESAVFFSDFKSYLPSYQALAGFAATQIYSNGKPIAVLIFQMPMDRIDILMTHHSEWSKRGFGETGETYLVNQDKLLMNESRFFVEDKVNYFNALKVNYPNETKEITARGTSVGIQPVDSHAVNEALKGKTGFDSIQDYRGVDVFSAYSPIKVGENTFALMAEVDVEEALRPATVVRSNLIMSTIWESVLLMAVATVFILWFASIIVRPLNRLGKTCDELSTGEGDLTVNLKSSGIPEIDRISEGFNKFISEIRDIISQVKVDADSLASASHEMSVITAQSEKNTEQQLSLASAVAGAMQELSATSSDVRQSTGQTSGQSLQAQASLNENMERAELAADNIKLLVDLIEQSGRVIGSLKNEVNQITTVLNVITSIADQTNLLALNAAIEAARAGEAGRGFSVVADEVRALATRSQESTVEISNLIEVMNQSATKSVDSMEKATAAASGGIHLVDLVTVALDELSVNLKQVLELTDTVAKSSEQQDRVSTQVANSIENISSLASELELGAKHTSSAALDLAKTASHSHDLVARFKV